MNGTSDIFNEHFYVFFHHPNLEYNETDTLIVNDSYTVLHPTKRTFIKCINYKHYSILCEKMSHI